MEELSGKTRRRRKKVSDYGNDARCNCRACDGCFETIKLKTAKVKAVKSEPVITQGTIEAMLELSGGRLSGLLDRGEAKQINAEPNTVYAKDTMLEPEYVYVEEQPLYKSK